MSIAEAIGAGLLIAAVSGAAGVYIGHSFAKAGARIDEILGMTMDKETE